VDVDVDLNLNVNATVDVDVIERVRRCRRRHSIQLSFVGSGDVLEGARRISALDLVVPSNRSRSTVAFRFMFRSRSTMEPRA
jgi:hypothetical protein